MLNQPVAAETIYALASGAGRAGVAVVRISGKAVPQILPLLTKADLPAPRQAALKNLHHPVSGEKIDSALVLYFAAPNSFTGEDVAELQVHGGRAVLAALFAALESTGMARPAQAGEFTRRAFENGKLDLTAAEAIADLVDAETEAQRRQALRQLEGDLGDLYHGWAERLKYLLAYLEAHLDFPDEDLPSDLIANHQIKITALQQELASHLGAGQRGVRLRDGIRVAILGAPNAGKSSLLNLLAAREAAIVAPTPGTTRDVIEVALDIAGYPVILQDTAGLRESADAIEAEGIKRAAARAAEADIKILLFDGTAPLSPEVLALADDDSILVLNKADADGFTAQAGFLTISTYTQHGVAQFQQVLATKLSAKFGTTEQPSLTRARHQNALQQAAANLAAAANSITPELMAEDLRLAIRALGQITGRVDVEDLLDVIFRDFCIGK